MPSVSVYHLIRRTSAPDLKRFRLWYVHTVACCFRSMPLVSTVEVGLLGIKCTFQSILSKRYSIAKCAEV